MGLGSPADLLPEPDIFRVLGESGETIRPHSVDPQVLIGIYRTMVLIRRVDERMMILQRQGRVGFYGRCLGQEAVPVAAAAALDEEDWIFPGLREGAAMLHRGYPLHLYLAQVFGNSLDPTRGRQMPSHQADKAVHQVSWSSCIGTQIPHAVGTAQAMALRGAGKIAAAFFGDGATSTPDFHMSLAQARAQRAPCLFVCQNNHWSISVPTAEQTRARTLAERGAAYGLPYARVDGNDAVAVYLAVSEASALARAGGGPSFIEAVTYRLGPHSSADDPSAYRGSEEVRRWERRDPLIRLRHHLADSSHWTDEQNARLEAELEHSIQDAVQIAEIAKPVEDHSLLEDVCG